MSMTYDEAINRADRIVKYWNPLSGRYHEMWVELEDYMISWVPIKQLRRIHRLAMSEKEDVEQAVLIQCIIEEILPDLKEK
jgi:hypothetical protein